MPLYVYRIIKTDQAAGGEDTTFEIRQSMHDATLTHHPDTGEAVERVICAPNIASGKLGNASLASAGFTKYAKMSDGTYEKQAGNGPKHIDPHGL